MWYHSVDCISAAWLFFSFSKECAGIYHAGFGNTANGWLVLGGGWGRGTESRPVSSEHHLSTPGRIVDVRGGVYTI